MAEDRPSCEPDDRPFFLVGDEGVGNESAAAIDGEEDDAGAAGAEAGVGEGDLFLDGDEAAAEEEVEEAAPPPPASERTAAVVIIPPGAVENVGLGSGGSERNK